MLPLLLPLVLALPPAVQETGPTREAGVAATGDTTTGTAAAARESLDPAASHLADARDAAARGDRGTTLAHLRAASDEAPSEPSIRLDLARVLNDLGRSQEAADVLAPLREPVAEPGPGRSESAWVQLEMGRALLGLGDPAGAEQAFSRALEIRPRLGTARLALAELLGEAGRVDEARSMLAPLIERLPADPTVALAQARLLHHEGRLGDAVALLQRTLEVDPTRSDVRLALGRLLLEGGDARAAWDASEPLLDEVRTPEVLRLLSRAARGAGRSLDAVALLGAALVDDPTDAGVLEDLVELLEHEGDLRRRATRRWIEAHPEDTEAWRELLEVDLDEGDLDAFFAALAGVPLDQRTSGRVRLLEGEALRRAGRHDDARAVLEPLRDGPDGERAWYELGLLAHAEGRYEDGADAFAHAAGVSAAVRDGSTPPPWAADAHYSRGLCLDRLGRYADAARAYEAAIARREAFPDAWLQLATCRRYRLGDGVGARDAYAHWLALGGDDPEVRRFVEATP